MKRHAVIDLKQKIIPRHLSGCLESCLTSLALIVDTMISTRLPAAGIAATSNSAPPRQVTLVGRSASFSSIKGIADTVASRHCTVMILGETGSGKEMIARYIHAQSDRAQQPFIPVDCSAISDTLFESQMFGHAAGAFTGAVRESLGFIRAAHGGSEIAASYPGALRCARWRSPRPTR